MRGRNKNTYTEFVKSVLGIEGEFDSVYLSVTDKISIIYEWIIKEKGSCVDIYNLSNVIFNKCSGLPCEICPIAKFHNIIEHQDRRSFTCGDYEKKVELAKQLKKELVIDII